MPSQAGATPNSEQGPRARKPPASYTAYQAGAIANLFLDVARDHGEQLTALKLHKLVYLAHGYHLAIRGRPLIDEMVEAWRFGPVIPSLYEQFREFGDGTILKHAERWEARDGKLERVPFTLAGNEHGDHPFTRALVRRIWEVYGRFTGIQLSNLTHKINTPWDQAWRDRPDGVERGVDIPVDTIRQHFQGLLA